MKRACPICNRDDRADIENALLSMASSGKGRKIEQIAEEYEVNIHDLKMHAMFHTPLVDEDDLELVVSEAEKPEGSTTPQVERAEVNQRDSIARQLKLRESDALTEATNEYLITLRAAGRRINRILGVKENAGDDEDQMYRLSKFLTKPMVDLYIGLGGEIRANAKALAEINRMVNGPQDDTAMGLNALAAAIRGSDTP